MWRGAGRISLVPALCAAVSVLSACGTALLETGRPTTDEDVAVIRRGGERLGCRELRSGLFRVYMVCEAEDTAVGLRDTEGKLGFACPDIRKRRCEDLFERMLQAGAAPADAGTSVADAGVASPDAGAVTP